MCLMASPGGTSSGSSSLLQSSSSEGDLQQQQPPPPVTDVRKQKRMLSNRESARRSRMRKQKHLDGLTAQVAELRKENSQILAAYKLTAQQYVAVEAENSLLRTQAAELSDRLGSLCEILNYMEGFELGGGTCFGGGGGPGGYACDYYTPQTVDVSPWNSFSGGQQPMLVAADMCPPMLS